MHQPETRSQPPRATARTLILGLGNVLLADEAVGALAVRRLEAEYPADDSLLCLDGGTLSFSLAVPIGDCQRLIVIDAAVMGDAPGTVRVFQDTDMDRQLTRHATSVHEVSLADLLDMARLTDSLPTRRALIGVEPALVGWGDGLTPAVEAALPEVLERVRELLARWDAQDAGHV